MVVISNTTRSSEINQLYHVICVRPEENVVWLNVSMHIPLAVEIGECREKLANNLCCGLLIEALQLINSFE